MTEFRSVAIAMTPGTSPASIARCSSASILLLRAASRDRARAGELAATASAALPATRNLRRLIDIGILPVMLSMAPLPLIVEGEILSGADYGTVSDRSNEVAIVAVRAESCSVDSRLRRRHMKPKAGIACDKRDSVARWRAIQPRRSQIQLCEEQRSRESRSMTALRSKRSSLCVSIASLRSQ